MKYAVGTFAVIFLTLLLFVLGALVPAIVSYFLSVLP